MIKKSILLFIFILIINSVCWAQDTQEYRVLFFGDSITAGYGLNDDKAFPSLMQKKADSLGLNIVFINAGLSGETSAGGLRRINWVAQQKIDLFVLELGGNDGLRGLSTEDTYQNLSNILQAIEVKHPKASLVVAGMQVPPNMGPDYASSFSKMYPRLAKSHKAHLIPFILEGVGGIKELNQADGIHPTEEGHQIIADLVWNEISHLWSVK